MIFIFYFKAHKIKKDTCDTFVTCFFTFTYNKIKINLLFEQFREDNMWRIASICS